jgi:spermidine synthase
MVIAAMLNKPEVTKVTVIELSEDVIALTAPTLKERYGDRFEVIQADGLEWKPPKGQRYGCVWADIWDNICADNLEQMTKFNRRYGRISDWHGNWAEDSCRYQKKQSDRYCRW